ncbi:tyrosine-type recombinase/integrase [Pseudonocardia sp. CA-142604]|uniref:tyrosine-type recombinase/integrase n=1 Tax=Pseudonocardia sp. CA-142604 TaxID=3240024 RepID=UPI003D8CDE18
MARGRPRRTFGRQPADTPIGRGLPIHPRRRRHQDRHITPATRDATTLRRRTPPPPQPHPPPPDALVIATANDTALDAHNVRRSFRHVNAAAGLNPAAWTPRELRHSFVSLLPASGVRNQDTSRLVAHSSTAVTERVYRHQLQAVLDEGTTAMDDLFPRNSPDKPSLSPGRNADGRLPRLREPPIVPSGRQDLNLRPLDPQDVRASIRARHKRSSKREMSAPVPHEQPHAQRVVPGWSPTALTSTARAHDCADEPSITITTSCGNGAGTCRDRAWSTDQTRGPPRADGPPEIGRFLRGLRTRASTHSSMAGHQQALWTRGKSTSRNALG